MNPRPWTYKATKVRVIDGDTIEAWLDLGFHVQMDVNMRLRGINTAERGTEQGDDATKWLRGVVASGKQMVVTTEKQAQGDKYGRILATLWVDGVNVNDLAVLTGHAAHYTGEGEKVLPPWPIPEPEEAE